MSWKNYIKFYYYLPKKNFFVELPYCIRISREKVSEKEFKKKKKEWSGTRGKVSSDSDDRLDVIIKCDNV